MSTGWIVLIVVLVILVALIIGLYFLGKRAEKETGRAKRTGGGNRPECDNAYHRQEKVTDQRFRSAGASDRTDTFLCKVVQVADR